MIKPIEVTDLKDKVAIVTGASSGIGRANARSLAKEGAKAVVAFRNQEELEQLQQEIEKEGGVAKVIPTDVPKPKEAGDIARTMLYAIQQPVSVNVNEVVLKPTRKS